MNNKIIIYKDGELELPVEVTPDKETASEFTDLGEFAKYDVKSGGWEEI